MNQDHDKFKHLLIILLEALSGSLEGPQTRTALIQERAQEAGLEEEDVHRLLDWIESHMLHEEDSAWAHEAKLESPSPRAFRFFGEADREYLSPEGMGYLVKLLNSGQINAAQMEALLHYSSFIAYKPLEPYDLESVLEQVLFRPGRPGLTGGASEGFDNIH